MHEQEQDEAGRERKPQSRAYAATETNIVDAVVNSFSLKSAAKMNLNFQKRKPKAAIGAQSRRSSTRQAGSGLIGR